MSDFSNPVFHDADKARVYLEARLWPEGPICPHCGVIDEATPIKGKTARAGLYQCRACTEQFTVTVGTVYERSHVPLNKWLGATHLMMASKKGMSALQISRMIGVTYKTAWFMCHRIRESLRETSPAPMGGEGKTVEADETYVGGKEKNKHRSQRDKKNIGGVGKEMVFSLVERGGKVRSHHLANISAKNLRPLLEEQLADASKTDLMTDGEGQYRLVGPMFKSHQVMNHGIGEYRFKPDMDYGEPEQWLCPTCFHAGKKTYLQPETYAVGRTQVLRCGPCKSEIIVRGLRQAAAR